MLYELSHTQGGLLPEIAQLLRFVESTESLSTRKASNEAFPRINTGVTPDSVEVYATLAGVDPALIDVTITNNLLTISGERKAIQSEEDNTKVGLNEIVSGQFKRTITLPEDVDSNQVEAHYREGILHLTIKRKAQVKARRISINTH